MIERRKIRWEDIIDPPEIGEGGGGGVERISAELDFAQGRTLDILKYKGVFLAHIDVESPYGGSYVHNLSATVLLTDEYYSESERHIHLLRKSADYHSDFCDLALFTASDDSGYIHLKLTTTKELDNLSSLHTARVSVALIPLSKDAEYEVINTPSSASISIPPDSLLNICSEETFYYTGIIEKPLKITSTSLHSDNVYVEHSLQSDGVHTGDLFASVVHAGNLSVTGDKQVVELYENIKIPFYAVESPLETYFMTPLRKHIKNRLEITLPAWYTELHDVETLLVFIQPISTFSRARYSVEGDKLTIEVEEEDDFNILLLARRKKTEGSEELWKAYLKDSGVLSI